MMRASGAGLFALCVLVVATARADGVRNDGVRNDTVGAAPAAQDNVHARIAMEFAPRVRLHPDERYALANVDHFFANMRLVFSHTLGSTRFDVDARSIEAVRYKGLFGSASTVAPAAKNNWSFEARNGCDWSKQHPACDALYLRASDPVAAYANRVAPQVYWRAVDRVAGGRTFVVVQYFFMLMLNDGQNKHEGEWESSSVVVDRAAFLAVGQLPASVSAADRAAHLRGAIAMMLMAGHYRQDVYGADVIRANADAIFVPGTAHYRHVMSLGGHGAYLVVPPSGKHEATMKCYEKVRDSTKKYDTWTAPVQLVRIDARTPWVRYAGRWGRAYSTLGLLPVAFQFSAKAIGDCEGAFGTGWLKSRVRAVNSAPYGPMFIHQTAWNWTDFPKPPAETPKAWR